MIHHLMHVTVDGMTPSEAWLLVGMLVIGHGLGILLTWLVCAILDGVGEFAHAHGLRIALRPDHSGDLPVWRFTIETRARLVAGIHPWRAVAVVDGLRVWMRPPRRVRFE